MAGGYTPPPGDGLGPLVEQIKQLRKELTELQNSTLVAGNEQKSTKESLVITRAVEAAFEIRIAALEATVISLDARLDAIGA